MIHPSFTNLIKKYDIIALTETWHTNDTCMQNLKENIPENFLYFQNARKNKHKRDKRNSGGIIVLYQKHLTNVISLTDNKTENMLWIKIRNDHCFEKNINLGVTREEPVFILDFPPRAPPPPPPPPPHPSHRR